MKPFLKSGIGVQFRRYALLTLWLQININNLIIVRIHFELILGMSVLKPQIVFLDNCTVHVKKEKINKKRKKKKKKTIIGKSQNIYWNNII